MAKCFLKALAARLYINRDPMSGLLRITLPETIEIVSETVNLQKPSNYFNV